MKDNKICECTSPQLDDGICICGNPINNEFDWCNDSGYNDVFHNEVSDPKEWMEIKRHPKDRGYGYKKSYNYEQSISEHEELKKQLPQFIKEGIQFAIIIGILLMFVAFVIIQIIKLLHIIL